MDSPSTIPWKKPGGGSPLGRKIGGTKEKADEKIGSFQNKWAGKQGLRPVSPNWRKTKVGGKGVNTVMNNPRTIERGKKGRV